MLIAPWLNPTWEPQFDPNEKTGGCAICDGVRCAIRGQRPLSFRKCSVRCKPEKCSGGCGDISNLMPAPRDLCTV